MDRFGFSLVELSIVLVILGLLTGGILAGQSLIRAAELRSVSADLMRFNTATRTFQDKYFALPGDMPNAIAFWNAQDADPVTCANTPSTSLLTCNGNGNGRVHASDVTNWQETGRFWQHLSNAGLIEGQYNGQGLGLCPASSPASRISSACFGFAYAQVGSFGIPTSKQEGNQFFLMGTNMSVRTAVVKPEEAWNLDIKLDDGNPTDGKFFAESSNGGNCYTGVAPAGTYALTNGSVGCALRYMFQ